jgi:hypothetical protein
MSYDLTIKSDNSYSESTDLVELSSFIERLPHIVSNGERGFCYKGGGPANTQTLGAEL